MNSRGFSFIELLFSQAIFLVAVCGVAGFWILTHQGLTSAQRNVDLSLKVEEVRSALRSESGCTANLANIDLTMANVAGQSVNRIAQTDAGVQSTNVLALGQSIDGHNLAAMTLKPTTQVDTAQISADLELTFQRSGFLGPNRVRRHVGLLAQVRQGKVVKCRLLQETNLSAGRRLCHTLTAGALNDFDPVRNECTLLNGEWITSSNVLTASCPRGYSLPANPSAAYNCAVREPAGFTDPSPPLPITLSDGGQITPESPPPYRAQIRNGGCECSYDIDIPPAVRAQFRCQILCTQM